MLLGGSGVFGSAIAEALRQRGFDPQTPSHIQLDIENSHALLSSLRARDVVIDAAGPFHQRTTALLEVATEVGFDVIDLSDNLGYALAVHAMDERFKAAGIRVFTSCSAVSTVTAATVVNSGVRAPARVSVCLLPASRDTSSSGTAASLLHSLSHPIRTLRDGRLAATAAWSRSRTFRVPARGGEVRGYLVESADAATLPRIWPGLRDVDFWVDTQAFGMNRLIAGAVRLPAGGEVLERLAPVGLRLARLTGSRAGGYVVEVEGSDGRVVTTALAAQHHSYLAAVVPATLAASSLAAGDAPAPGVVPADRHCHPDELFAELRKLGIEMHQQ